MFANICNVLTTNDWFNPVILSLAAFGLCSLLVLAVKASVRLCRLASFCYRASRFALMSRLTHISRNIYGDEKYLLLVRQINSALLHAVITLVAFAVAYVAWRMPATDFNLRLVQIAAAMAMTGVFFGFTAAPPLRVAARFVRAQYRSLEALQLRSERALRQMDARIRIIANAAQVAEAEVRKQAAIRLVTVGPVPRNLLPPGRAEVHPYFEVVRQPRRTRRSTRG